MSTAVRNRIVTHIFTKLLKPLFYNQSIMIIHSAIQHNHYQRSNTGILQTFYID